MKYFLVKINNRPIPFCMLDRDYYGTDESVVYACHKDKLLTYEEYNSPDWSVEAISADRFRLISVELQASTIMNDGKVKSPHCQCCGHDKFTIKIIGRNVWGRCAECNKDQELTYA